MNFNFISRRAMNGGKDPKPPDAETDETDNNGVPPAPKGRRRRTRSRRQAKMRMPASTAGCRDWSAVVVPVRQYALFDDPDDLPEGEDPDLEVPALVVTGQGRADAEAELELVAAEIQDTPTILELRLTSVASPVLEARSVPIRFMRAFDAEIALVQRVVINGAVAIDVVRDHAE